MRENLYDRANRFFKGIETSPKLKEQIKGSNYVIQFDPNKGEPFYVEIRRGKVDFGKGKKHPPDVEGGLYIIGDEESLDSLFRGEMSLGESMFNHKIQVPGFRDNKEHIVVWFSKLLQKGIEVYGLDHL